MLSKSLLLIAAASMVLADPVPAPVPQQTSIDLSSLPTDPAGISSQLASVSSLVAVLSGMPTIPASVASVLATAIPASELTKTDVACIATATPAWYSSLPGDVKTALSSYESAFGSWYSIHSSELGTSGATDLPAVCEAAATTAGAGTTTGAGATATSSGAAAASTTSPGAAAPRATGAMAASFAGVVGVLGVVAVL